MTATAEADILLVDDDVVLRERLARGLRDRGFLVGEAGDLERAVQNVEGTRFRFALVDLRLPSASGLDVVREIHQRSPGTGIVVLTGYGSIATALEAIRAGAIHYLQKPATIDDILAAFARSDDSDARSDERRTGDADDVPSLDRVEWEHINRVLADSGGNVSEAARRLGLHRRSLQRKLAKRPSRR